MADAGASLATGVLMDGVWREQEFDLRFQLSDLTLLRVKIPLLVHACTLTEILTERAPAIPEAPRGSSRGYFVRSCPGAAPQRALSMEGNYVAYRMAAYEHCYIDLRTSFEEYQAKFSSKTRNGIARKIRRFSDCAGKGMKFERYARPDELQVFYPLARGLSAMTYQERLLDLGLPQDARFVSQMMAAGEQDRIRAFLLFDGDRPVAYLYCPLVDAAVVYGHLGFDPAYSDRSPGTVLLWLSLESLFAERKFLYFDFTEGSGPQKQLFSTGRRHCYNALYMHRRLYSTGLLRAHYSFQQGSLQLGRVLDRIGLKKKVKHLLRGT